MQFEIMDFQHFEADGNEVLGAYVKSKPDPTCDEAETIIKEWLAEMVYNNHLDDTPYIVTVEEDEGQFIAMVSNDDVPFILYSALPA